MKQSTPIPQDNNSDSEEGIVFLFFFSPFLSSLSYLILICYVEERELRHSMKLESIKEDDDEKQPNQVAKEEAYKPFPLSVIIEFKPKGMCCSFCLLFVLLYLQ